MGENIETFLAQLGNRVDEQTGAVSAPIHLSTTYSHPNLDRVRALIILEPKILPELF